MTVAGSYEAQESTVPLQTAAIGLTPGKPGGISRHWEIVECTEGSQPKFSLSVRHAQAS